MTTRSKSADLNTQLSKSDRETNMADKAKARQTSIQARIASPVGKEILICLLKSPETLPPHAMLTQV